MSEHTIENTTVFSTNDSSKNASEDIYSRADETIGRIKSKASDILSSISILQDALIDIYFNYDCSKYKYRFAYYLKQLPRWKHLIETGIPTPKNYPGNSASDYNITPIIDYVESNHYPVMIWFYDVITIIDRMKTNLDNLRTWLFEPDKPWYRTDSQITDHNYRESYYAVQRLKLEPIMIREIVGEDVDQPDYLCQKEGLPLHLIKPPEYYGFAPPYIPPSEAKLDGPRYGTPRYDSRNIDTQVPPDHTERKFCRGSRGNANDDKSETTEKKSTTCERPPYNPFSRSESRSEDIRYRSNYISYNPPRFLLGGVRQEGSSSTRNSARSRFGFQSSAQKYGSMKPEEKKESAEKKPAETKPEPKIIINNIRITSISGSDED